jgi:hypothetical protein
MAEKFTYRRIKSGRIKLSPGVAGIRVRDPSGKVVDYFTHLKNARKVYPGIKEYKRGTGAVPVVPPAPPAAVDNEDLLAIPDFLKRAA